MIDPKFSVVSGALWHDHDATAASTIAALAGATLVLGVVYWLMRERDDRLTKAAN